MHHTLANQDCLEFIKRLDSSSVDMILTDPPYSINYDGGKGWDSQWKTEKDYLAWCSKWSEECIRVLKPNRMMVVFGTLKTDTFLRYKLDVMNSYKEMVGQTEIIWSYNWGGRSKTNFARKHEYAWCYSKGEEFLFNADDVRIERKQKKNIRTGLLFEKGTIPTAVWEKNNHTTSAEYVSWHPTQKPLEILERLIKAYTLPENVVLDLFSGSGSTMIACEKTNRLFVGCELEREYYNKSLVRYRDLCGVFSKEIHNQLNDKNNP
jgi:site-specific DNA-methyltransferase (adenine-specific)